VFENQTVGVLRLIYTSAPFTAALKREIVTGALFFFLLVCVAGVVAFASLQTIVGRPVQRLITSIRKSEKDDRREAVNWSSQDELGSVITAYNNMLQQVEENTNELIAAREQAESAAHTKSRFLANMSHELRTPLNAVIGITEMLREEAEDENKDTEPYDRVAGSGRHLLHLIDDILDFSKIEAGKVELAIEEVDLRDLLEDVIATAQPLAEHGGNSLVLEYKDDPPYLLTDPLRLRQIVLNLLSNACKFTEDGTVRLTVVRTTMAVTPEAAAALFGDDAVPGDALLESAGDGSVVVSGVSFTVKDTGIGISKEQSATLFEDFSQADNSTTRRYGGTGLGLAISQRLCNLLGGSIKLESRLGEGATFSFTLPSQ
jgi:signal transduction histidine kinase